MAIFHCHIKIHTKRKSIFGAIAYRSGSVLTEPETGQKYDYTKKSGVIFSDILLCDGAPEAFKNREKLWRAVQLKEKASDAQLAREFEISLPRELSLNKQIELAQAYARYLTQQGMCVDFSMHSPEKKGKNHNPHVHYMCTTRPIEKKTGEWLSKEKKEYALDENGERIPIIDPATGKQKIGAKGRRLWKRITVQANPFNKKEKVEEWRKSWEVIANKFLKEAGLSERIDCRSLEAQGIDRIPLQHEGIELRLRERGIEPYKKNHELNEEIKKSNAEREEIKNLISERLNSVLNNSAELVKPEELRSIEIKSAELVRPEELRSIEIKSAELVKPEELRSIEIKSAELVKPEIENHSNFYSQYKRYHVSVEDDSKIYSKYEKFFRNAPEKTGVRSKIERLAPQFYEISKSFEQDFLADLRELKIKSARLIERVYTEIKSVFSKFSGLFKAQDNSREIFDRFESLEQAREQQIIEKQQENLRLQQHRQELEKQEQERIRLEKQREEEKLKRLEKINAERQLMKEMNDAFVKVNSSATLHNFLTKYKNNYSDFIKEKFTIFDDVLRENSFENALLKIAEIERKIHEAEQAQKRAEATEQQLKTASHRSFHR